MMASPVTVAWPKYRVSADLPSLRVAEPAAAALDAEIAAHPYLVNFGVSVGASTISVTVKAPPTELKTAVLAEVERLMAKNIPSTLSAAAITVLAFGAEVVAPTITQTVDAAKDAADWMGKLAPWAAVLAVVWLLSKVVR